MNKKRTDWGMPRVRKLEHPAPEKQAPNAAVAVSRMQYRVPDAPPHNALFRGGPEERI